MDWKVKSFKYLGFLITNFILEEIMECVTVGIIAYVTIQSVLYWIQRLLVEVRKH